MPLNQIPVLPESYPLFDWADYQSSRDALVKGTPTKQFAVAAWNALVDDLEGALSGAGIAWDETYTTADGAKIQTVPGKLSSDAFNSVRLNIDRPAPLGWQWALNENFRGYVGREEMQGVATHGKARDRVFPEYIIELARKLNVLIEIMRGTAMLSDAEISQPSRLNIQPEVLSKQSAPVNVEQRSAIHTEIQGTSAPGAIVDESDCKSYTTIQPKAEAGIAQSTGATIKNPSLIQANGNARYSRPLGTAHVISGTIATAEMEHNRCVDSSAEWLAASRTDFFADKAQTKPVSGEAYSKSRVDAETKSVEALAAETQRIMHSRTVLEMDQSEPIPAESRAIAQSAISSMAVPTRAADTGAVAYTANMHVQFAVSTAWYPPVWVDGGLWIRQSHSVTQNENGELVIM